MAPQLIYLSDADIRSLQISPDNARQAVLNVFRENFAGGNSSLPKNSLDLGPGHGFQSMVATSPAFGLASLKWVSMVPVSAGSNALGIQSLICANDLQTGTPRAIMNGNEITLLRTAAMSAAAASLIANPAATTLGLIGCGLQAYAHLEAFTALYPGLRTVQCHSRSRASAEKLAHYASEKGLQTLVCSNVDELLINCDLIISMVPGAPGLQPFLDAGLLRQDAFVSAVDIGRSWLPESFSAFALRVTDSLAQSKAPYDINSQPVQGADFHSDLITLAGNGRPAEINGPRLFCFRGFALADLALASVALERAHSKSIGTGLDL